MSNWHVQLSIWVKVSLPVAIHHSFTRPCIYLRLVLFYLVSSKFYLSQVDPTLSCLCNIYVFWPCEVSPHQRNGIVQWQPPGAVKGLTMLKEQNRFCNAVLRLHSANCELITNMLSAGRRTEHTADHQNYDMFISIVLLSRCDIFSCVKSRSQAAQTNSDSTMISSVLYSRPFPPLVAHTRLHSPNDGQIPLPASRWDFFIVF